LGRSAARNRGADLTSAEWLFFLDADDRMCCDVSCIDTNTEATFGSVCLDSKVRARNIHPCGWRDIALYGSRGTLSMGFFCRADVARRLRFDEALDAGEDFDFYLRLSSFTKRDYPLVKVGYDLPSATGPRGYVSLDWVSVCNGIIAKAVEENPQKYDLRGDAILAKAVNS
jgi:glycosyltransferase involved in cell wall biosynthesis